MPGNCQALSKGDSLHRIEESRPTAVTQAVSSHYISNRTPCIKSLYARLKLSTHNGMGIRDGRLL